MMVIPLFTPCAEDKIVFPDLIFLFVDFRYKKKNPQQKDSPQEIYRNKKN